MKEFLTRLKFVKAKDILAFFPMLLGAVLGKCYALKHPHLWLVCERKAEARDNGYWFFKYLCEQHSEQEAVYAIDFHSVDYPKVVKLGKVIPFGTLRHWIYYFAAEFNISSQKEGKPNAALCFFMEVYLGIRDNRIYLKHGIIKDDQKWIYYRVSKLKLFCCASVRECDYIRSKFGYPKESVQVVGLCRFDNLLSKHDSKKQVLVLPTWREWLGRLSSDTQRFEKSTNVADSEYFCVWNSFLKSQRLAEILKRYGYTLLFYPHPSMQQYMQLFDVGSNENITLADSKKNDMQQLLMESAMLITDYSSIYFDFAYMKKPLLYYQFDYEKYRIGQYQEGYFSYERDGFGPIVKDEPALLDALEATLQRNCSNKACYDDKVNSFFAFKDARNCERTYTRIMKSKDKE